VPDRYVGCRFFDPWQVMRRRYDPSYQHRRGDSMHHHTSQNFSMIWWAHKGADTVGRKPFLWAPFFSPLRKHRPMKPQAFAFWHADRAGRGDTVPGIFCPLLTEKELPPHDAMLHSRYVVPGDTGTLRDSLHHLLQYSTDGSCLSGAQHRTVSQPRQGVVSPRGLRLPRPRRPKRRAWLRRPYLVPGLGRTGGDWAALSRR
jgi:hypothetical protein